MPGASVTIDEEGRNLLSCPTAELPEEQMEGHVDLCDCVESRICQEGRLLSSSEGRLFSSVFVYQVPVDNNICEVSVWVTSWSKLALGLDIRWVVSRWVL